MIDLTEATRKVKDYGPTPGDAAKALGLGEDDKEQSDSITTVMNALLTTGWDPRAMPNGIETFWLTFGILVGMQAQNDRVKASC
jgi:hypothetical protein